MATEETTQIVGAEVGIAEDSGQRPLRISLLKRDNWHAYDWAS